MDIKKLTHLNAMYIAEMPLDQFIQKERSVVSRLEWGNACGENLFKEVCKLMQSRAHTFTAAEEWKYFFVSDIAYDEKAVKKNLNKEGVKQLLIKAKERLATADFSAKSIEDIIRGVEKENGMGEGKLNQPV